MKRPNFFIVGAGGCGTTALYQYLNEHPEIYMSEIKEPNYFGRDSSFKTEAEYLGLFAGAKNEIRLGEATPLYLRSPRATEAIYKFDPNAKIIIMLRDPVSLMLSSYWRNRLTGRERSPTFKEALAKQAGKTKADRDEPPIYRSLPLLTEHVQRYFKRFGRMNVYVIIFDDFKQDTAAVYKRALDFLGVDVDFKTKFHVVNAHKQIRSQAIQKIFLATGLDIPRLKRSKMARRLNRILPKSIVEIPLSLLRIIYMREQPKPQVDPELKRQLEAEFVQEIERLGNLLGRNLCHWCGKSL